MSALSELPTRPVRKVLLYSHDTYGLGHIRRNLAIGQHLLALRPNLQVVLASGSIVGHRFDLPQGLNLVALPAVVKDGPDSYRPLDERLTPGLVRRARTAVIADVARRLQPDVLLVDHAPAGMGGELRDVLDELRRDRRRPRIALGLRDVLDGPENVVSSWSRDGIYSLLETVYDEIYVYGQREVFDVAAHYRIAPEVTRRMSYTGYLDRSQFCADESIAGIGRPFLLATAGGGGDGAEMLSAALEAGSKLGIETVIVTGPLIDARQRAVLDARAAVTPRTRIISFHPGVGALMKSAAVVVTMGGYNSMAEAAAAGTPTIVVPRTWPRREQTIRADLFAARGLVTVVPQGPGLADRLGPAIATLMGGTQRAFRRELDLGGLDRLASGLLGVPVVREQAPAAEERAA